MPATSSGRGSSGDGGDDEAPITSTRPATPPISMTTTTTTTTTPSMTTGTTISGGAGAGAGDDGVSMISIMVGQQQEEEQEVAVVVTPSRAATELEEEGRGPASRSFIAPMSPPTEEPESLEPPKATTTAITEFEQEEGEEEEEVATTSGWRYHNHHVFRCMDRCSSKRPRVWAICYGLIFPLGGLIIVAIICGYPIALLESPIELDSNDDTLEEQMRLFVEASLYTNITQNLPRICLALYFTNSSVEEFVRNVTILINGPPSLKDYHHILRQHTEQIIDDTWGNGDGEMTLEEWINGTTYHVRNHTRDEGDNNNNSTNNSSSFFNDNRTTTTKDLLTPWRQVELVTPLVVSFDSNNGLGIEIPNDVDSSYDYSGSGTGNNSSSSSFNATELAKFVSECGQGLSPIIDKMFFTLAKTANSALDGGLSFAWSICPHSGNQSSKWHLGYRFNSLKEQQDDDEEEELSLLQQLQQEQQQQEEAPPIASQTTGFLWDLLYSRTPPPGWENTYAYYNSDSQTSYYRRRWEMDRRRLYNQYLNNHSSYLQAMEDGETKSGQNLKYFIDDQWNTSGNGTNNNNTTEPTLAQKFYAYDMSLQHATGRDGCVPHVPAACWFWFTVMTTIGYGNTSPATMGGRVMVFTIGFVSILIFGGVSARAAYVITSLLEDSSIRWGVRKYLTHTVETIVWGIIYLLWMLAIAHHYVWWQHDRLGDSSNVDNIRTGYWFAYISTTTVGFGDYYLEPEVLRFSDLAVFPLMFLIGFSFLAAFLTKLSESIRKPFVDGETLVARFKKADDEAAAAAALERRSKTTTAEAAASS